MKVFEVTMKYLDRDNVMKEVQFVASEVNTLKAVTDHFATHCEEYEKDLKGVREILTVAEHVER